MQGNRGRDTGPELRLRSALHRRGWRYRVDRRPEPSLNRRADLVFPRARVAVFVDGCYWHGCPTHYRRPTLNGERYWGPKIEQNRARDRDTNERLADAGWTVVRLWEHEPLDAQVRWVELALRASGVYKGR